MKTILVTGFDAFGGEALNPSWEAARRLEGVLIAGHRVAARQIPCVFGTATDRLEAALVELRPDFVVSVGLAASRCDLSVERLAVNIDDARIPDNAGAQPIDVPVIAGGPAAYFSSLPIKAIVRDMLAAGLPASVSQTAGSFVCNHLFYAACHLRATRFSFLRGAGFIHIPYAPEQAARHPGAASLASEVVVAGLRIAVATSISRRHDIRETGGLID